MLSGIEKTAGSLISIIILTALLAASCGGGGSALPPPGNQNLGPAQPPAKTAPPNGGAIMAFRELVSGALTIAGEPGAVAAEADVVVIDAGGKIAQAHADFSGAFMIAPGNLPPGFTSTAGSQLTVTQQAPGMSESDGISITVVDLKSLGI